MNQPTTNPTPAAPPPHCRNCGAPALKDVWRDCAGGTRQRRLECGKCGSFQSYLRHTNAPVALQSDPLEHGGRTAEHDLQQILERVQVLPEGNWWQTDLAQVIRHPACARFIRHARKDVPRLMALVRYLQALLADLKQDASAFELGVREGKRLAKQEAQKWKAEHAARQQQAQRPQP